MAAALESAPVLSTPDTNVLTHDLDSAFASPSARPRSDAELSIVYDIDRTLREIKAGKWKRIGLQFPDSMLPDAPRVFQLLSRGLAGDRMTGTKPQQEEKWENQNKQGESKVKVEDRVIDSMADSFSGALDIGDDNDKDDEGGTTEEVDSKEPVLYILADTSYGACCVDEIAAEHIDADVVIHYGRACLSPTTRVPAIYVFTHQELNHLAVIEAFKGLYSDKDEKVLVGADVTYSDHVNAIVEKTRQEGYKNVYGTQVIHDPSAPIPNRKVPDTVIGDGSKEALKEWRLFHISDPPTALLLTLSSRVKDIHIYPTQSDQTSIPVQASTAAALRRRYGMLTKLSTVPIFGILINTLSVKHYLYIIDHVKAQIAAAGKKSYMFVVGKLNPAKLANFSEIGGWVVVGCWESSLVDSHEFWKPVITPFELEMALKGDLNRVWTGDWTSDYQTLLDQRKEQPQSELPSNFEELDENSNNENENDDSEPESAPPEFDLRTGRYVSVASTRPMRPNRSSVESSNHSQSPGQSKSSKQLTKRAGGEVAMINGVYSPGADFLRSQRTWRGLGSDFEISYEDDEEAGPSTNIVEGRRGIASGYTVGEDPTKR